MRSYKNGGRSWAVTSSVAVLAFALSSTAVVAQTTQDADEKTGSPVVVNDQASEGGNEIIVTGSRIARAEISSPNPIVSFSAATLQQSGHANLTDFLVQSPALLGSLTSADQSGSSSSAAGSTGTNLLNLRNLGTDRTLVLIDGRRHVAGLPGSAAVDVNTFPKDLIERVDIQTGGASAIYGADGVSGVVNFVLKRNFEGLTARFQTGISNDGDAGNQYYSITGGKNFADGRGNVALSYEYTKDNRLNSMDRAETGVSSKFYRFAKVPGSIYARELVNDLRYADSSRNGAIDLGRINGDGNFVPNYYTSFDGNGKAWDDGVMMGSGGLTQGGSSTPVAGYAGDLRPDNRIHNINLLSSFEVSPALRIFAQGKYTNTKSYTVAQPSFDFATMLAPDNAYLVDRFGAGVAPNGAFLSRDNFDLGVRGESTKRETFRGVLGADGRISDNATYEVSYVYGQTRSRFFNQNYRLADRYYAALDAVADGNGNIVCRSTIDGGSIIDPNNYGAAASTFTAGAGSSCRPLNLLGEGVASKEALDFINVDLTHRYKVSQQVLSGSISGDFGQFFELPGGPIGFAVGAEYRKETSEYTPDAYLQAGEILSYAQVQPEQGSFNVKEVFAELRAPLLKDMRFAKLLEFDAALRLSDYSTVGRTTTWALSGIYAPINDIRFRATYSQAVRAPNIGELFSPVNGTWSFINDPCDPSLLKEGTQYRAANCQAQLAAAGLSPAQISAFSPTTHSEATATLPGRSGGNRDLMEETAKTWTVGVVLQPSFIPRLTITADWFNIRLANAIRTATAQEIVDLCVDQPTLDNVYCQSITRDPTKGFINGYLVGPQNVAAYETAGLDVSVRYTIPTAKIGTFAISLAGNYLDKLTYVPTPGADVEISKLNAYMPEYSGQLDVTWANNGLTVNYGLSYFSKTRRFSADSIKADPNYSDPKYFFYRAKLEHDVQVAYDVNEKFRLYGGVNNIGNDKGDLGSTAYPFTSLGRYFYAGAQVRFK